MTYRKLQRLAAEMGPEEIADSLKGLVADQRFAAVVALIEQVKEDTADHACNEQYAAHHGLLEHANGVRRGLNVLAAKIKQYTETTRRSGPQRPETV